MKDAEAALVIRRDKGAGVPRRNRVSTDMDLVSLSQPPPLDSRSSGGCESEGIVGTSSLGDDDDMYAMLSRRSPWERACGTTTPPG